MDSCQNVATYAFTGISSPEPNTSLVRGSDSTSLVEGVFEVTFARGGDGTNLWFPTEDFMARYESEDGEVEWTWQEAGSCERESETGTEVVDVSTAMDCARSAFSELGLDVVVVGSSEDARVSLRPETLRYVGTADEQRTVDHRAFRRYEPFSIWEYGDGLIEAGPDGHVRWVTTWSDGTQWTLALLP